MNFNNLVKIKDVRNYLFHFFNIGILCNLAQVSTEFHLFIKGIELYQIFTSFYLRRSSVSLYHLCEFQNLELLKYFINHKLIYGHIDLEFFLNSGNVNIIEYLLKNKQSITFNLYDIKMMIKNKHFHIVNILYTYNYRQLYDENILYVLCRYNYLDTLKWYHDHNFLTNIPIKAFEVAAKKGNLDIIKFLIKINPLIDLNLIVSFALHYGKLNIIKEYEYLVKNYLPEYVSFSLSNNSRELYDYYKLNNYELPLLNTTAIIESVIISNFSDILIEIIQIYRQDIVVNKKILVFAAMKNKIDLLTWLYNIKPTEFYSNTIDLILTNSLLLKNYESIKWIFNYIVNYKKIDISIDRSPFYEDAMRYKEYDLVLWCFTQKPPIFVDNIIIKAITTSSIPILDWIDKHNYELKYSKDSIITVFNLGYVEIATYLKNSRYSLLYEIEWIDNIILAGHVPLLKFIYSFDKNISTRFTQEIFNNVLSNGSIHMVDYLYSLIRFKITLATYQNILKRGNYRFILWLKKIKFTFPSKKDFIYDESMFKKKEIGLNDYKDIYFTQWLIKNNFCIYKNKNQYLILPDN